MRYNRDMHRRRSIRLKEYDYSQSGAYFVTICAWNRECLFGEVVDGGIRLNESGIIIQDIWNATPNHFQNIELDEFIIMPNHIHGIVIIVGAQFIAPFRKTTAVKQGIMNRGVMNHAPTVGEILRAFKGRCTHAINKIRNTPGIPVWQRNYYEHIVRNDSELNSIREYIMNNPLKWDMDENNPVNVKK